jgi:hypothetical protein
MRRSRGALAELVRGGDEVRLRGRPGGRGVAHAEPSVRVVEGGAGAADEEEQRMSIPLSTIAL